MSDETVPIHLVQRLLAAIERRGDEVEPVLRSAGLSPELVRNPRARVTLDQLAAVTRVLWVTTDDELFGLGPPVPLGTFRLIARSALGAPDLRTFLIRFDQASHVILGLPRIAVHLDEPTARIEVDTRRLDDPEHLATDTLIAFIHRTIGWAIGRRVPLTLLRLPYDQPRFLRYYEATFGRIPEFGAACAAIGFDASILQAPVLRDESELATYIAESPRNYFSTRDYGSSVADQVRRVLETGLVDGNWPVPDEVASRLAVSTHHLRRLLREEDTSITQLREDILRDAAINSLVAGRESVEELSARLGFSEASAFRRAFRRWTGMPPGAYRAGLGDE